MSTVARTEEFILVESFDEYLRRNGYECGVHSVFPQSAIPYQRPNTLSNPYDDFSEETLHSIVTCQDSAMGVREFSAIFRGGTPAGSYEECAYFIRLAVSFISGDRNGDTIVSGFMSWLSNNIDDISKDGLCTFIVNCFDLFSEYIFREFCIYRGENGMYSPIHGNHAIELFFGFSIPKADKIDSIRYKLLYRWLYRQPICYHNSAWILFLIDGSSVYPEGRRGIVQKWRDDLYRNKGIASIALEKVLESILITGDADSLDFWDQTIRSLGL